MRRFVIAMGLSAGIVLLASSVEAQYRYTDDKGVSREAQYKLYVPAQYRDAAVWIGPTGVGKPALSEEQRRTQQRWDTYRRTGESALKSVPYRKPETVPAAPVPSPAP